jgi:hypothetical protein
MTLSTLANTLQNVAMARLTALVGVGSDRLALFGDPSGLQGCASWHDRIGCTSLVASLAGAVFGLILHAWYCLGHRQWCRAFVTTVPNGGCDASICYNGAKFHRFIYRSVIRLRYHMLGPSNVGIYVF